MKRHLAPCLSLLALVSSCSGEDDPSPPPCSLAEICDGEDQDCDGAIDEGVQTFYHLDGDDDGFGDFPAISACEPPPGYVLDGSDCNDTQADIYPGATELCDGLDQDCDAAIDEGAYLTFYLDSDGDGFGDSQGITNACQRPPDYAEQADDCDDTKSDTYPGAEELCDSRDNDCDDLIDEGALLDSGVHLSICNPTGWGMALSPGGFTPGISGYGWRDDAPIVFETNTPNGSLDSAQAVPLWGSPMILQGSITEAGYDGLTYTGDVDVYEFQTTTAGTLTITLFEPEGPGVNVEGLDLFAFDERAEGYVGPITGMDTSLTLPVATRSTYFLLIAGRSGLGGRYGVRVTFEGSATPHRPNYQIWYGGAGEIPFLGTATSPDGKSWANFGTSILMGADCAGAIDNDVLSPSVSPGPENYSMAFLGLPFEEERTALFEASSFNGIDWTCDGPLAIEGLPEEMGAPFAPALFNALDGGRALYFLVGGECIAPGECASNTLAWASSAPGGALQYEETLLEGGEVRFTALATEDGQRFTLVSEGGDVYAGGFEVGGFSLALDPTIDLSSLSPWQATPLMGAVSLTGALGERIIMVSKEEQGLAWR